MTFQFVLTPPRPQRQVPQYTALDPKFLYRYIVAKPQRRAVYKPRTFSPFVNPQCITPYRRSWHRMLAEQHEPLVVETETWQSVDDLVAQLSSLKDPLNGESLMIAPRPTLRGPAQRPFS